MNITFEMLETKTGEDELLFLIGKDLVSGQGESMFPITSYQLKQEAKKFLDESQQAFRGQICGSELVRNLYQQNKGKPLVLAIADLIAGICIGVTPITVAYLLFRRGLELLCPNDFKPSKKPNKKSLKP